MNFPILNLDNAPDAAKPLLKSVEQGFGFVPNLIGIMASSPAITKTYLNIAENFSKSTLSPTEQQIVLLTVSYFHKCHYCMAAHTAIAGMQKVDPAVVEAIRNNQPLADSKLQALRDFTHSMVQSRGWVSEDEATAFLSAGYTESHMLDVLVGISQKMLSNFTNHLAKTPLDKEFSEVSWNPAE